jgi:hypothetical protein
MSNRVRIAAGAGLVLALPSAAAALEYCVTCEDPPAMYRCVVDGTADGPGKDPTASLHCISEMAKLGKHRTCSVSRGAPFPCPGLTTIVQQPKSLPSTGEAEPPATPMDGPAAQSAPEPHSSPADKSAKVPRTVEELADQTVKSSKDGLEKAGEQIGNAGSAIGTAASKTWNCLTSLFTSCGGNGSHDSVPPPDAEPEPAGH